MGNLSGSSRTGRKNDDLAEGNDRIASGFEGVIQDSASTATLAAILTAREKTTGFSIKY